MRKLSCRDAGMLDCNWEVTAINDEECLRQAREHGRLQHKYNMTPEDEQKLRQMIRAA